MIKIKFVPPEEFLATVSPEIKKEWEGLIERAKVATQAIIAEWESYKQNLSNWRQTSGGGAAPPPPEFDPAFDDDIWKGFRDWMKNHLFHNKCAYCETGIVGFIADAEHFRPKAQVRYEAKIVKIIDQEDGEITHPGYFWLAYNWKNLLPSCHTCNRYGGKKTNFPAKSHFAVAHISPEEILNLKCPRIQSENGEGVYYLEPEDLDAFETRLLLHPFFDDPQEHIYFDSLGNARVKNESQMGKESIDVFDLNHIDKVKYRRSAQIEGLRYVMGRIYDNQETLETMKAAGEKALKEFYQGDRQYAAAVFDYVQEFAGKVPLDREKSYFLNHLRIVDVKNDSPGISGRGRTGIWS